MRIEAVDFFYLKMPEVLDVGDGSQDATLVRVRGGGLEGWGECEAAPLPTIAAFLCPMSHSACKPVKYSVIDMELNEPLDILKISKKVHKNSFDLLQADHTLSGIDIALWDLLGKHLGEPVYSLLGYKKAYPKTPYASQLFGDTPEITYQKAVESRIAGFKAVKFGWGAIGLGDLSLDEDHFRAAREGFGDDKYLMIDIGTAWGQDVNIAQKRLKALHEINAYWLEEPFENMSLDAYSLLAKQSPKVGLAAGEGCNNYLQAVAMMNHADLRFIQIDTGRIGGITPAKQVADIAIDKGITYVNHTFTSQLALSASLQPYAGIEADHICEFPLEPKQLAVDLTIDKFEINNQGQIDLSTSPGLGIQINTEKLHDYLLDVEIKVNGVKIYETPVI